MKEKRGNRKGKRGKMFEENTDEYE